MNLDTPLVFKGLNHPVTVRQLAVNDPVTGGNKIYKLKFNLQKARDLGYKHILTYGGAWSNHIAATARRCKEEGFHSLGIIRGEKEYAANPVLSRAVMDGMELVFVTREQYREKNKPGFIDSIIDNPELYYMIPEGGANADGVKGCMEILTHEDEKYSDVIVACGTGTTAAGIILSMKNHQRLTGISILSDKGSIEKTITAFISDKKRDISLPQWNIIHDFHFGGYAKTTPELNRYSDHFFTEHKIQTEPVYTGKMFYALEKLISGNYFNSESRILAVHTGGLQYLISR